MILRSVKMDEKDRMHRFYALLQTLLAAKYDTIDDFQLTESGRILRQQERIEIAARNLWEFCNDR